jgi:hypothetical protein
MHPASQMSKGLKIPVSTLFETLKEGQKIFDFTIVLKGSIFRPPSFYPDPDYWMDSYVS